MKVKIMSGILCLKELDACDIDHIKICRYFDTEQYEKSNAPEIKVDRSHLVEYPAAKSGRIMCIYEVKHEVYTMYLFNADYIEITFEPGKI